MSFFQQFTKKLPSKLLGVARHDSSCNVIDGLKAWDAHMLAVLRCFELREPKDCQGMVEDLRAHCTSWQCPRCKENALHRLDKLEGLLDQGAVTEP